MPAPSRTLDRIALAETAMLKIMSDAELELLAEQVPEMDPTTWTDGELAQVIDGGAMPAGRVPGARTWQGARRRFQAIN